MWAEVLRLLCLFGLGAGAITWLTREVIKRWLDSRVEQHRLNLQHANDHAIEKLKNDLQLRSIEHEIRFRSMHEKQAEVIADTYQRLRQVFEDVAYYVQEIEWAGAPTKAERLETLRKSYQDFRTYFYPRLIYFPIDTGNQTRVVADKLVEIANKFARGMKKEERMANSRRDVSNDCDEDDDYWERANTMMETEVPPLLNKLRDDFQRLLGVVDTSVNNGEEPKAKTE